jgi:ribosomal protein S18 acetylase RimI-like enzyme
LLDKSIPYFSIIMKRPKGASVPQFELPAGYTYDWFASGREVKWAEIETSVGEFETKEKSLAYFEKEYLPHSAELKKRSMFVLNQEGEPIGTITGWWSLTGERCDVAIHWFAVRPEYQGLGIGKALISACIRNLLLLEGDQDIYLHTQTWSHRAIALYLKSGFNIEEKATFSNYKNDYEQAYPILEKFLSDKLMQREK